MKRALQGEPAPQSAFRPIVALCRAHSVIVTLPIKQKPRQYCLGFWVGISDDDLLSRGIPRTIIGAASFHGPVRYGKAWGQRAMVVREDGGKTDPFGLPRSMLGLLNNAGRSKDWVSDGCLPSTPEAPQRACGYRIKPHGQLVRLSLTCYHASTRRLSTSWSRTTL